jgi:hypothetical protein
MSTALGDQLVWLLVLALPIASVSWTVTHKDVFREPRDYCAKWSTDCRSLLGRKFFSLFTCEYCFSHYVTLAFLIPTGFRLLLPDWRGAVIAFFALVAVANVYMSAYSRLRVEIRGERVEIESKQKTLEEIERAHDGPPSRSESGR